MRRLIMLSAIAAVLSGAPVLAAPSHVHRTPPRAGRLPPQPAVAGLWKLPDNNVVVRLRACGQALCGNLVSADKLKSNPRLLDKMNSNKALRSRPVQGLLILYGFTGGPTEWKDGSVYNPDDGRTYKSELTLSDPNTLQLKGCVVKPLCKSKTLTRTH